MTDETPINYPTERDVYDGAERVPDEAPVVDDVATHRFNSTPDPRPANVPATSPHRHPGEVMGRRPVRAGRPMTLRELAAEKRRTNTRNGKVTLPVMGIECTIRRKTMEDVMLAGRIPAEMTNAVNEVIRESNGINDPDIDTRVILERVLDEDGVDAVTNTIRGFDEALIILGCAWPQFVDTAADIDDPDNQMLIADLDEEDFDVLAAAIGGDTGIRLADFRNPSLHAGNGRNRGTVRGAAVGVVGAGPTRAAGV